MSDFLVKRDDVRECRVAEAETPELRPGQALLRIARFGLTANNVTYAVMGDAMRYWRFFGGPEGWGRLPTWGFAELVASEADGLEPGGRVFGYLPASDHLVVEPGDSGPQGFLNAAPHLEDLPSAYHRYVRTDTDPFYEERYEDHQMLLWPLFFTSFLIDDELADGGLAGAGSVVISSASSKTALAAAFMLAQRAGVEVVGLTSAGNVEFVDGLGVYDSVVPYDEVEELPRAESAFVDIAGDRELRGRLHRRLADRLTASIAVGAAHWEELGATELGATDGELPGPAPRLFFAPDRVTKRSADWGGGGLRDRVAEAWQPFVEWVAGWLEIERAKGLEEARDAYLEVLEGKVPPSKAHVVEL